MNKQEVQKRVLKDGKPLALSNFNWCEETRTFSSSESGLVLDFRGITGCTFKTGSHYTFKTGSCCTFRTGYDCTFTTGYNCTFKTDSCCTFTTGHNCTFTTGYDCTFTTGYDCTFTTGYGCTFDTISRCTFDTGGDCVIVNRNGFEVIQPKEGQIIQICPYGIEGHLVDGMYKGEPHIIVDGILSKIINQKGNVYKVINHGDSETSWLIKEGDIYSHGETLEQARESLIYKISDRDTSKYKDLKADSVLSFAECVAMYRTITGACEGGVKSFVEQNKDKMKDSFKVSEIIEITKGQYGHEKLREFIAG